MAGPSLTYRHGCQEAVVICRALPRLLRALYCGRCGRVWQTENTLALYTYLPCHHHHYSSLLALCLTTCTDSCVSTEYFRLILRSEKPVNHALTSGLLTSKTGPSTVPCSTVTKQWPASADSCHVRDSVSSISFERVRASPTCLFYLCPSVEACCRMRGC